MAETPEPLTDDMLDGSERIRVGRRMMRNGERTGPVKVWSTSVLDIIKFARRISPTVKSLALSAAKTLTFTTTDGVTTDLGSIAGPKGDKGDAGLPGAVGTAGPKGDTGSSGATGATGPTGATGGTGPQGPAGVAGPKGDTGATGSSGPQGLKGDKGDTGPTGSVGPTGPAGTPKRIERYTAATNASGVATFTFPAFTAAPDIDVIQTWIGDQQVGGGVTAQTLTGCTVLAKVSRGTLLLTSGPFQTAPAGVSVTIRVIGS